MSYQCEGHEAFASGIAGNPAIGIGTGQGLNGTDVIKHIFSAGSERVHGFELPCVLHRRQPGFQKIGAKRDQKVCLVHVVRGQAVEAEYQLIGGLQRFIGIGFEHQRWWTVQVLQHVGEQLHEALTDCFREHACPIRSCAGSGCP